MALQAQIPAALAALHNFILDKDNTQAHVNKDVYDSSPGEHLNPEELFQPQGTTADTCLTEEESEEGRQLQFRIQLLKQCGNSIRKYYLIEGIGGDLNITEDEAMDEHEEEMESNQGSDNGSDD